MTLNPKWDAITLDITQGVPIASNSKMNGLFDPLFQIGALRGSQKELTNVGSFPTVKAATTMWNAGIVESARILAPGGKLLVKIQDVMGHTGTLRKNRMPATAFIEDIAENNGLVLIDKIQKDNPFAYTSKGKTRTSIVNYLVFQKAAQQ